MVRAREPASRSLSRASTPSVPGISRSRSITSGSRLCASLTTSSPSAASPTTSKSGWVASTATRPSRSIGWSSATRSFTLSTLQSCERYGNLYACTFLSDTLDRHGTAQYLDPLPHADDTVPTVRSARGVEAVSVVHDDESHCFRSGHEPDRHTACACVAGDVGEGLLADAVEGDLDPWRERVAAVDGLEPGVYAGLRLPAVHERLERLGQRAALQRGGPQVEHGTPGLVEVGTGQGERAAQRFPGALRAGLVVEEGLRRLQL